MAFKIFGYEFRRSVENEASLVPPNTNDGAVDRVVSGSGAALYGYAFDYEKRFANEVELINKYRAMSHSPEIDSAVEEITSEAIVFEDGKPPVSLAIFADDNTIPANVRNIISEEFDNIVTLMKINSDGHDIFRKWYVDGRYYGHIVVDETDLSRGIVDIRQVDSRKMKKIREVMKTKSASGADIVTGVEEYFMFNDSGINSTDAALKLSCDSVIYAPSGLLDESGTVISFLHKAIKPYNQLRYMEDAVLIYTLSRAPQRRVFYIDVADMPKQKAEQYVQDIMNRYKNKVVYDSSNGEVKDDRVHTSMLEDYWMPRRSSGRTTEITTIPGDTINSQLDSVMYFMNKLFSALNLPLSRIKADQAQFNLGRASEISRDEVKYSKFVDRLRNKFGDIFLQALRVQLILKGIIAPEDWTFISSKIRVNFHRDNYFAELKENEILMGRIAAAQAIEPYIGKVFSWKYVKENIFKMDDVMMDKMSEEMGEELEMMQAQMAQQQQPEQTPEEEQGNDEQQ